MEEAGKEGDILYWMRAGGIRSKFDQVMTMIVRMMMTMLMKMMSGDELGG